MKTLYQLLRERNQRVVEEQRQQALLETTQYDEPTSKPPNYTAPDPIVENDWYDTILDIHLLRVQESQQERLTLATYNEWFKKHTR